MPPHGFVVPIHTTTPLATPPSRSEVTFSRGGVSTPPLHILEEGARLLEKCFDFIKHLCNQRLAVSMFIQIIDDIFQINKDSLNCLRGEEK